jgi:hypothetical protein
MDIGTRAKNAAAVLGTISTLAYVSGYLALRARAHALGTDPSFTLVDEAYVFAGFRFFFISLIVLLLLTPVILWLRQTFLWSARRVSVVAFDRLQWVLLGLVTMAAFWSLRILGPKNLLLQQVGTDSTRSVLQEAIMGGNDAMSLLLTASTLLLAILCLFWLCRAYATAGIGTFTWTLGALAAVQLFMLPIYHGVLFAERKVRILAAAPETVKEISPPLGIVDRTSQHFTLLGRNTKGKRVLVTVKRDDLNGIPTEDIVSLKKFLENHLGEHDGASVDLLAMDGGNRSNPAQAPAGEGAAATVPPEINKSFFQNLISYLHVTFEAIGSLSESAVEAGQLWAVALDGSGAPSEPRRVGAFDGLSWPVAGPDGATVYAIQQGRLVRLAKDGQTVQIIGSESQWVKLLGVAKDHSVWGLVYDGSDTRPATRSGDGHVEIIQASLSEEEQMRLSLLLQESRSYAGGRSLFSDRSLRGGRGFDIFMTSAGKVIHLSDCGDDRCGQASLSPDFKRVLFIREPQ